MARSRFGRRDALRLGVAVAGTAWLGGDVRQASAQSSEEAIANCLGIVRGCFLPDGSVLMAKVPWQPKIWIPPYFAAYANLALLAAHARYGDPEDLRAVGRWLTWCALHQQADGYWFDYEGSRTRYFSNGKVDAWDSSAAIFLIVLDRYRRQGGIVSPGIIAAALKALHCLVRLRQTNGLIWGKGGTTPYKVQLFMDLCEVYGGCVSARGFFASLGSSDKANLAKSVENTAAAWLPTYWRPANSVYAWALHNDFTYQAEFTLLYPNGLAQIFGCAFVQPRTVAWDALNVTFQPEHTQLGFGPEWWLYAASRFGGTIEADWRAAVAAEAATFTPTNVYIHRPAHAALGLLEGADWMPSLLNPSL